MPVEATPTPTPAAAPAPAPAAEAPTLSPDEQAIAEFDAAVSGKLPEPPKPEPEKVEGEEETPPAAEAAPAEPEKPAAEAPKPTPEDEAKAAVEKEINDLGIKNVKTAERFRDLANQSRELATIKEKVLPQLQEAADREAQWQHIVTESTATAQQLQAALAYMQAINSGDPGRKRQALDAMMKEVTALAGDLGVEIPGLVDPLAKHPDIAHALKEGDITRELALELVAQRTRAAQSTQHAGTQNERVRYTEALNAATDGIDALSERLKASDPLFAAKLPFLAPSIDFITANKHPSEWVGLIEQAYRKIPAPVAPQPAPTPAPAATAPPPVGPMPLRPTGVSAGTSMTRRFKPQEIDDGVPFDVGMREAS